MFLALKYIKKKYLEVGRERATSFSTKNKTTGKNDFPMDLSNFFHTHQHGAFKSVSAADSSQDDTLLPYYPSYPIQLSAWLLTKLIMFTKRISH